MIFLSLVLVIVAAVTLVLGVFQDGLVLIYVSIATCVAAMAVLGAAVLLRRREEAAAIPAGYRGAAGAGSAVVTGPATGRTVAGSGADADEDDDATTVREVPASPASTSDADAPFRRPETDDAAARPVAKRAVVRRTTAAATPGGQAAPAKKAVVRKSAVKKAVVRPPTAAEAGAEPTTTSSTPAASGSGRSMDDLASVRGLGPAKRARLLEHFGSVDAIAAASMEDLTALQGIGPGTASAIKDALR